MKLMNKILFESDIFYLYFVNMQVEKKIQNIKDSCGQEMALFKNDLNLSAAMNTRNKNRQAI